MHSSLKALAAMACAAALVPVGTAGAASKPPLKFMAESSIGSPLGSFPGDIAAAKAAANAINKRGGVNGRKIQLITCNNHLTSNGAAACARQAVSSKVIAVFGSSPTSFAANPILAQAGIASAYVPVGAIDVKTPTNFPINGGGQAEFLAAAWGAKKAGAKTMSYATIQFPGLPEAQKDSAKLAAALGIKVLKNVEVDLTQTSFASTAQQLRQGDPDNVGLFLAAGQVAPMIQAMKSIGFNPTITTIFGAFNPQQFSAAAALTDKWYVVHSMPSLSGTKQFKSVKLFQDQMNAAQKAKVKNAGPADRSQNAMNAWAQLYGFAAVARKMKGTINNKTFMAALKKTKDVTAVGELHYYPGASGLKSFPGIKKGGPTFVGIERGGKITPSKAFTGLTKVQF